MPPPPDPLETLLDRWQQTPAPPPDLSRDVWRRIALVDNRSESPGLFARIEAVFSRPSFAAAYVVACLLFGLFLAQVRLSRLETAHSVQLAQSYLHLIDPLINQPANRPPAPPP